MHLDFKEDEFKFVASGKSTHFIQIFFPSPLCVADVIAVCLTMITLNISVDCVRQLTVFTSVSQLCSSFSIVS